MPPTRNAELYVLREPATPDQLLDCVKLNIARKSSVVVSVIYADDDGREYQSTYYSTAQHRDLAYHAMRVDNYLRDVIGGARND